MIHLPGQLMIAQQASLADYLRYLVEEDNEEKALLLPPTVNELVNLSKQNDCAQEKTELRVENSSRISRYELWSIERECAFKEVVTTDKESGNV